MSYIFALQDPDELSDHTLLQHYVLVEELRSETIPDDPLRSPNLDVAAFRKRRSPATRRWATAHDASTGLLVATATTACDLTNDPYPDALWVAVKVHAAHRRRGVGRRLVHIMQSLARDMGKSCLLGYAAARWPGALGFMDALGGRVVKQTDMYELPCSAIDIPTLSRWAEASTVRSAFSSLAWDGAVPKAHLPSYLNFQAQVAADRAELELATVGVRNSDDIEPQDAIWTIVARDPSSHEWLASHSVRWEGNNSSVASVQHTTVLTGYRRRGLARWLKARMTLRLITDEPDLTLVRTFVDTSNFAMKALNHSFGFRLGMTTFTVELPT